MSVPKWQSWMRTFKSSITNLILAKPFTCSCARRKQGSHFLATLFGESAPAWQTGPEPRNRSLDDCRDRTQRARLRPDQSVPADCRCGSRLLERGVRPHSRHVPVRSENDTDPSSLVSQKLNETEISIEISIAFIFLDVLLKLYFSFGDRQRTARNFIGIIGRF